MSPELRALDDAALFDWLRLIRSENIGPRTFMGLLRRFGSAGAALDALPGLPGRAVKLATPREIESELDEARRGGIRFVALCEPDYPAALRAADSAPPILAVKGKVAALQRPIIAIVGSRNASATGLILTERLARGFGAAGHVVASGLARGIDIKAHLATLDTGTVAVLAGGHGRIYPAEHARHVPAIAEHGAVVSEMPFAWEPRGRDFPRRNRIVSGLSIGVVVVEAARRSGSLITARFANEQGRDIFAVPGSPLDPRAEGTNDLIRQGATLCTGPDDVLDALSPLVRQNGPTSLLREASPRSNGNDFWDELDSSSPSSTSKFTGTEDDAIEEGRASRAENGAGLRSRLLGLIGPTPVSTNDLTRILDVSVGDVQSILMNLELDGIVERSGANLVSRRPAPG